MVSNSPVVRCWVEIGPPPVPTAKATIVYSTGLISPWLSVNTIAPFMQNRCIANMLRGLSLHLLQTSSYQLQKPQKLHHSGGFFVIVLGSNKSLSTINVVTSSLRND